MSSSSTDNDSDNERVQPMYVYADGACMTVNGNAASGYGVVTEHKLCKARLSEAVVGEEQSAQLAEVEALQAALELVRAVRPLSAVIRSDSQYAVQGFNTWRLSWAANGWRRADGSVLAFKNLWMDIDALAGCFRIRGIKLNVEWRPRNSSRLHADADQLAKYACSLHVPCRFCGKHLGRASVLGEVSHHCGIVCRKGSCTGVRTFVDSKAYEQHIESCHSANCRCRREGCDAVFGSRSSAIMHENSVHDGYVFDCEYCTSVFTSPKDRDDHYEDDCSYSPYCPACSRWFVNFHAYEQHARDYHGH